MRAISVEVIVYRAEAFYFASMDRWQGGLAMPLTTSYRRRSNSEKSLAFAADSTVKHFWRRLNDRHLAERLTINIAPSLSTAELVDIAMRSAQSSRRTFRFPGESFHKLYHLESGASIEEGRGVDNYRLEDGDHLGLIIQYPPSGCYMLAPVPNAEALFAAIRSTSEDPPGGAEELPAREQPLLGALLYTDEDPEIATYTRNHFASLHEASGPNLQLYVIEQPEGGWREASRYWKGILNDQLLREWTMLGWLRSKPHVAAEAYAVARRMGVYPDQLPCLVLFDRLDNTNKLVFPLLSGSARFFRSLFGSLQRLIIPGQSAELSFSGIRQDFGSVVETLRNSVEVAGAADRIEYRFEGNTVFINKPTGPVSLSDFQNQTD